MDNARLYEETKQLAATDPLTGLWNRRAIERRAQAEHERWDGKSYPDGLEHEAIPKLARIVALADAYSAMTTDRPYRKALSQQEALQEIRINAGTQFDPELSRLFIELVLSGKLRSKAGSVV